MKISEHKIDLKSTYELGLGKFNCFSQILINKEYDGKNYYAELCYLDGYHKSSYEDILSDLNTLRNKDIQELSNLSSELLETNAIIDQLLNYEKALKVCKKKINSKIEPVRFIDIRKEKGNSKNRYLNNLYLRGKLIGSHFSLEDINSFFEYIADNTNKKTSITLDANGSLTINQVQDLFEIIKPFQSRINIIIEQPCNLTVYDYGNFKKEILKDIFLDESINTLEDILLAAKVGVKGIKLKSCKFGGYENIIKAATHAKKNNLLCSLGNGFSTGISNIHEISAVRMNNNLFTGGFEGIGFNRVLRKTSNDIICDKLINLNE